MIDRRELSGWSEIAKFLGISIRAAQMREKELGLPVHRVPGAKGRVWADSAELDGWRRSTIAAEMHDANMAGVNDDSRTPGTAVFEQLAAVPSGAEPSVSADGRADSRITSRWKVKSAWAALAIGAGLLSAWTVSPHGPPADFHVEGRSLIVTNEQGRELWRHTFPFDLYVEQYGGALRKNRVWMGDLTGNGSQQTIFVAASYNSKDIGTPVFCFGPTGKVLWQFMPGREVIDGKGARLVPPYLTSDFEVLKGKTPADTRVAFTSAHYLDKADQVAFLDIRGKLMAEYWHPGHILHTQQIMIEGRSHLLLGGVNNGNHQATLILLDPLAMVGVTTPKEMKDHHFELLGMNPAVEEAVVFFPRSCISVDQPYTRVATVSVTNDRIVTAITESTVDREDRPGFVYEFDHRLRLVGVEASGSNVAQLHRELELRGEVRHRFDPTKESTQLRNGVEIRWNKHSGRS